MGEIKLVEIKEEILSDNQELADALRAKLTKEGTMLVNIMSSPGAGKTSLILHTLSALKGELKVGVLEADIESTVDSEKIAAQGIPVVQVRTGGACHLEAAMVQYGLEALDAVGLNMVLVENVGNLVCPAEFDTGAHLKIMILSVPEGDDKPLKYPLMFSISDALVINKIDYLPLSDFDPEAVKARAKALNPHIKIFTVSCRTGEGIEAWITWLKDRWRDFSTSPKERR
ncbi:MAG TPA: hydrogenase nickel incorporation protein HypB [Syntrophales bacterium]|nr:hydrogenase nickel incorporation protein HypB [Syntrophales bacterium]HOL58599.1 hydrogenase nickel incorporation protein HypB [Syntrophales bacterium]HPO34793.1 hydrogenase nickel incorporation protein HypB [Syntrophales bacterium]